MAGAPQAGSVGGKRRGRLGRHEMRKGRATPDTTTTRLSPPPLPLFTDTSSWLRPPEAEGEANAASVSWKRLRQHSCSLQLVPWHPTCKAEAAAFCDHACRALNRYLLPMLHSKGTGEEAGKAAKHT
jgi:hypothetical protein